MDLVVLVDEHDNATGVMDKLRVHQEGLLHRAVSVVVFNRSGQMLLQQRAAGKYHSPLLWTNACCTHPAPEESAIEAASRRLNEEMGLKCELKFVNSFIYKAVLDNGLTEYELDHVFVGITDDHPEINEAEVADWKCVSMAELLQELNRSPSRFTAWFPYIFERVNEIIK